MPVYYTTAALSPDNPCAVCAEEPNDSSKKWVAHTEGTQHSIHQKCLKRWLRINPTCPTCRAPVALALTQKISNYFRHHAPAHAGSLAGGITAISVISYTGFAEGILDGMLTGVALGFICGTITGFLKESAFLGIGILKYGVQDLSQLKQKLINIPYESLRFGSKSIGVGMLYMLFYVRAFRRATTYHGPSFLASSPIYILPWFPIAIVELILQISAIKIPTFLARQATSRTTQFIANLIF